MVQRQVLCWSLLLPHRCSGYHWLWLYLQQQQAAGAGSLLPGNLPALPHLTPHWCSGAQVALPTSSGPRSLTQQRGPSFLLPGDSWF